MKKIFNIQTLVILMMILMPSLAHAIGGPDSAPGNPDNAPIDGGLSLLIAGGVGYGVKRLRAKRQKQKEQ